MSNRPISSNDLCVVYNLTRYTQVLADVLFWCDQPSSDPLGDEWLAAVRKNLHSAWGDCLNVLGTSPAVAEIGGGDAVQVESLLRVSLRHALDLARFLHHNPDLSCHRFDTWASAADRAKYEDLAAEMRELDRLGRQIGEECERNMLRAGRQQSAERRTSLATVQPPQSEVRKQANPRAKAMAKRRNHKRDEWVAKQRAKSPPTPWQDIYDEGARISAKRGWDMPLGGWKPLSEAYYRFLKNKRDEGRESAG